MKSLNLELMFWLYFECMVHWLEASLQMSTLVVLISFSISLFLLVSATAISKSASNNRWGCFPFECGFDTVTSARLGFSNYFYLIALVFLVFDVEIALILPLPLSSIYNHFFSWWVITSSSVVILVIGLMYEWMYGSLCWM